MLTHFKRLMMKNLEVHPFGLRNGKKLRNFKEEKEKGSLELVFQPTVFSNLCIHYNLRYWKNAEVINSWVNLNPLEFWEWK